MEWIDETIAIGSWVDLRMHAYQRREGIELCLNARSIFDEQFFSIGRRPNLERVMKAADLLQDLSSKGVKVMVHCHHGRDRSSFLVMVYLSKKLGIGYQEAFEMVRKGRPRSKWHPEWVEQLERK
jgi:predicted protein tyrosine phosphatase